MMAGFLLRQRRKKGKKRTVIERNTKWISDFHKFLQRNEVTTSEISSNSIDLYVKSIEDSKKSAKGPLYVLMNYFQYLGNKELSRYTADLREERTKKSRRVFPLSGFLDIDPEVIEKLHSAGVNNVNQMIEVGRTNESRIRLAESLSIPLVAVEELVALSDITRVGYVKAKLSRLYYNAGIRSADQIANYEVDELYNLFKDYIDSSKWNGMIPNKSDLAYNIERARKLSPINDL